MMRSMFSGVSGLRIHQTRMDVIANNIANVNTAGYKSSRVTFFDVFNQTVASASRPDPDNNVRGRNAMQIGLGANLASIDQIMTTGAAQRTDYTFDLMIQGDGFFIVSDEAGNFFFTRAGAFRVDEAGNVTNSSGMAVNGWQRRRCPDTLQWIIDSPSRVSPLRIGPEMEFSDPMPTSRAEVTGNLNVLDGGQGPDAFVHQFTFYDSLGTRWITDIAYTFHPAVAADPDAEPDPILASAAHWRAVVGGEHGRASLASNPDVEIYLPTAWNYAGFGEDPPERPDGPTSEEDRTLVLSFDIRGNLEGVLALSDVTSFEPPAFATQIQAAPREATLGFGLPGAIVPGPGSQNVNIPNSDFGAIVQPGPVDPGAVPPVLPATTDARIRFDFATLRQTGANTNATATSINGAEPGVLQQFVIGEDGIITGIYSNGRAEVLGQIAITQFRNPAGLEKVGGSIFRATGNSGQFDGIGFAPGTQGTTMLSGVLEMSNVDLSAEFSDMIITQRGFQSNSRVITTSDEMLMELVNLKR